MLCVSQRVQLHDAWTLPTVISVICYFQRQVVAKDNIKVIKKEIAFLVIARLLILHIYMYMYMILSSRLAYRLLC